MEHKITSSESPYKIRQRFHPQDVNFEFSIGCVNKNDNFRDSLIRDGEVIICYVPRNNSKIKEIIKIINGPNKEFKQIISEICSTQVQS